MSWNFFFDFFSKTKTEKKLKPIEIFWLFILSLAIYFPKRIIQKLTNSYYYCLPKLLNIRFNVKNNDDFYILNNKIIHYNLDCFQHRLIKRLSRFIYKTINFSDSPIRLKSILVRNCSKNLIYNLRNSNQYIVPSKGKYNEYREKTFDYFYSIFINNFLISNLQFDYNSFNRWIDNNINLIFVKFCKIFINFDIFYKKIYNW